ncbi:MAG: hypothetical protein RIQ81_1276, partial [Pseudomonadota bacterium]
KVVPSNDDAALDLVIESQTTADSVGYNQATRNIGVNVSFSTFTRATTTKRIFLTDRGILVTPAQSWASTNLTIHNIDVFAGGLFQRLKRRMAANAAWRKLMQEKANQERQVSQRVADELNVMADAKAGEILAPANEAFKKYFINGFYKKGRLPGALVTQTTNEGLFVKVMAPATSVSVPNPRLDEPGRGGISAHLHGAVISRIAESLLAGVEFKSGEVAEIANFISGSGKVVPRNDQFSVKFRENNPAEFTFDGGTMIMRLYITEVTQKGGHPEAGGIIEARFPIARDDLQSLRLRRDGEIVTLPMPPASRPSSLLQRAIDYYFNNGGNVLDQAIKISALPGPLAKAGVIELKDLSLNQGWFLLETNFNPATTPVSGKGAH